MIYSFDQAAIEDFTGVADFYALSSKAAAVRFIDATFRAIELLVANPQMGQAVVVSCRRVVLKGFPVSLIYQIDEAANAIRIVAVTHQSRRPGYWEDRVREEPVDYAIAA